MTKRERDQIRELQTKVELLEVAVRDGEQAVLFWWQAYHVAMALPCLAVKDSEMAEQLKQIRRASEIESGVFDLVAYWRRNPECCSSIAMKGLVERLEKLLTGTEAKP